LGSETAPQRSKMRLLAPWPHRPRQVHPAGAEVWVARKPPRIIKKKALRPMATPPPAGSPRRSGSLGSQKAPRIIKKKALRPLATPPPAGSPVGAQVWQREYLPNDPKKCGSLPLGHTDSTGRTSEAWSDGRLPPSRIHQHKDSQRTPPSVAVSAAVEQLNQRSTRPPKPQGRRSPACRTPGPTARGLWGLLGI